MTLMLEPTYTYLLIIDMNSPTEFPGVVVANELKALTRRAEGLSAVAAL